MPNGPSVLICRKNMLEAAGYSRQCQNHRAQINEQGQLQWSSSCLAVQLDVNAKTWTNPSKRLNAIRTRVFWSIQAQDSQMGLPLHSQISTQDVFIQQVTNHLQKRSRVCIPNVLMLQTPSRVCQQATSQHLVLLSHCSCLSSRAVTKICQLFLSQQSQTKTANPHMQLQAKGQQSAFLRPILHEPERN